MFCSNCGTSNQDGVAFCANCGNPLVSNTQPAQPVQPEFTAPVQPESAQPEYAQPTPAAPKKNLKPIIIGAIAVIAVIILLFVFLGGSGASSPEDAAITYIEGSLNYNLSDVESVMLPEVLEHENWEEVEDSFEEAEEYYDELGISVKDVEVTEVRNLGNSDIAEIEEMLADEVGAIINIDDAKRIEVSYDIDSAMGEYSDSQWVVAVLVDGDWYIIPDF